MEIQTTCYKENGTMSLILRCSAPNYFISVIVLISSSTILCITNPASVKPKIAVMWLTIPLMVAFRLPVNAFRPLLLPKNRHAGSRITNAKPLESKKRTKETIEQKKTNPKELVFLVRLNPIFLFSSGLPFSSCPSFVSWFCSCRR